MNDPQKKSQSVEMNPIYDIAFDKNKDAQVDQFIVEVLGKKTYPANTSHNDYIEKASIKDLLIRYTQINNLSEAESIKYHFKLFALMITMGNTDQNKYDNSVVGTLFQFGQHLRKPENIAKNTLYKSIGDQLEHVLAHGDSVKESSKQKKAFFHQALVSVITNLRAECQSSEGKDLYANMMLKFLHVRDVSLKDNVTIQLGGNKPTHR